MRSISARFGLRPPLVSTSARSSLRLSLVSISACPRLAMTALANRSAAAAATSGER